LNIDEYVVVFDYLNIDTNNMMAYW